MPIRKVPLGKNAMYHIYNRSIAGFEIFHNASHYERLLRLVKFYMAGNQKCSFSQLKTDGAKSIFNKNFWFSSSEKLVEIVAYCMMPTHFHFILKEIKKGGIKNFVRLTTNSYSKYFNIKYRRKGPLWEGPFKNVAIENDSQLLHLTRYIHLNPVTAKLVNKAVDWEYSSYREYIGLTSENERLCNFSEYIDINIPEYKKFVSKQIEYQRELALIKHLIFKKYPS